MTDTSPSDDEREEYRDDEAYLDAIRAGKQTTSEIAEAVGVTRQGADYRLRQLRDEGTVTAEMVGNTLVWSIADDEEGR